MPTDAGQGDAYNCQPNRPPAGHSPPQHWTPRRDKRGNHAIHHYVQTKHDRHANDRVPRPALRIQIRGIDRSGACGNPQSQGRRDDEKENDSGRPRRPWSLQGLQCAQQNKRKQQIEPFLDSKAPCFREKERWRMPQILHEEQVFPIGRDLVRKSQDPRAPHEVEPQEQVIVRKSSKPAPSPKSPDIPERVQPVFLGQPDENPTNQKPAQHEEQFNPEDRKGMGPLLVRFRRPRMRGKHEDDRHGAQDIEPKDPIFFGRNHKQSLSRMAQDDVKTLFTIRLT